MAQQDDANAPMETRNLTHMFIFTNAALLLSKSFAHDRLMKRMIEQNYSAANFANWMQDENHAFHGSWETDFGEGMKSILDVVHPDLTSPEKGETLPTLLMPFRRSMVSAA